MPGAVAQRNNPANDPNVKPVKHHSNFRPNSSFYAGQRYGDISALYAMPVIQGDHINLRVNADVDTYTLKAPIMSPVRKNTTAVYVPLRAILPNNYELLVTNPLTGEDIDPAAVNTVSKFEYVTYPLMYAAKHPTQGNNYNIAQLDFSLYRAAGKANTFDGDNPWDTTKKAAIMHAFNALQFLLSVYDKFISKGSVANTLGLNFTKFFHFGNDITYLKPEDFSKTYNVSYDSFIDMLAAYVASGLESMSVSLASIEVAEGEEEFSLGSETVGVYFDEVPEGSSRGILFRDLIQMLRDGRVVLEASPRFREDVETLDYFTAPDGTPWMLVTPLANGGSAYAVDKYGFKDPVNYGRCVAYQLAACQFFTDDAVDFVYTPSLYHQNQLALASQCIGELAPMFYNLNGTRHQYDSCSGAIIAQVLQKFGGEFLGLFFAPEFAPTDNYHFSSIIKLSNNVIALCANAYLSNIFGFQSSLRYRDYFVGSRKHPLGVGDTSVTVNNDKVDVVDITKNIQMQRFLNQVNRIGRTLKAYTRGIFGVTPATNPEECIFLANTVDVIGGEEYNNTGEAQVKLPNATTAKFRGESNKYLFQIDCSDPGYILVLNWYEIVRPMVDAVPRDIFHVDRFDMFNPFMENIGDQPLYLKELDVLNKNINFAYKMRYAEYKQSFDRAVGPFADGVLPGYALPVTSKQLLDPASDESVLSSYFIRPRNSEFDPLYVSLTNFSTSNYFHFIVRADIEVDANRPMEAAPQIL